MSNRKRVLGLIAVLTIALATAGCGNGGASSFAGGGSLTVGAIQPQPFYTALSAPFTVSGSNFESLASPAGSTVIVRFTSTVGTPFVGGTSNTVDVPGTVVDGTTISGSSPLATFSGTFTAFVTVILPSTVQGTSTTAIATFIGLSVTGAAPTAVDSENPQSVQVQGTGFVPTAGIAQVRFFVDTGTPFLGGTANSITVPGTITSPTTLDVTTPVAGVNTDTPARIEVTIPAGVSGASVAPLLTFRAPTLASASPTSIFSQVPTVLTLTGARLPAGGACTVTFRDAGGGTPFVGDTVNALSVPGTVVNNTTITCVSPICGLTSVFQPEIVVALPSGATPTLATGALTIDTAVITAVAPLVVDQAVPTAATATGMGFGPVGACTVTVSDPGGGTPFLGGTAASISVTGAVVNDTTITFTTPICGLLNKLLPNVSVTFPDGGTGFGAAPLFTLEVAPTAVDDAYTAIGNVEISVSAANGVIQNALTGDSDPDGDPLSVSAFDAASANAGTVAVAADGSFTYDPPPGFEGADTFTYTITDGFLFDTATVTVTVSDVVWFVDEDALVNGDGRFTSPFDSLANFIAGAADDAGDYIFLYDSPTAYAGELTLLNDQLLIGQGVDLVVQSQTLVTATAKPLLLGGAGSAVTLGSGNTIRGLDISNSAGNGILGTTIGTLNIDTVEVFATGGAAIDLDGTGTLAVTFDRLTSINATDGVDVVGMGGSLTVIGSTTVTSPSNDGINLANTSGAATFSFSMITITDAGRDGIDINNHDGTFTVTGTTTISDPTPFTMDNGIQIQNSDPSATFSFGAVDIDDCQLADGIDLTSVGGAGITFGAVTIDNAGSHGVDVNTSNAALTFGSLAVTTLPTAGPGIEIASTGGSFRVTGAATINAPNGHGINAFSVTSPYDMDFGRIIVSAYGPARAGVRLASYGGAFTVTGDTVITGAAGTLEGILISSGVNMDIDFQNLTINDPGTEGIRLDTCSGAFTVNGNTDINHNVAFGADGIEITRSVAGSDIDFTGTVDIDDSTGEGILLDGCAGSFTFTNPLTITDPSGTGLLIRGNLAASTIDFDAASIDIIRPLNDGIFLDGTTNDVGGTFDCVGTVDIDTPGDAPGTPSIDHGVDIDSCSIDVTFADLDINDSNGHAIELSDNPGDFICQDGLIDNPDDVGLHATTCTGKITLGTATTGVTIQEAGDGAVDGQEGNCARFDDCTGDIRCEGCAFEDANETPSGAGSAQDNNGILVDNRAGGTLGSLQVIDCDFVGTEVAGFGTTTDHGVHVILDNGSIITDFDVTGCLCSGLGRAFCEVLVDIDDDGDTCSITNLNISSNGTAGSPLESQAELIHVRVNGASTMPTFTINNNIMTGVTLTKGNGIRFNTGEFAFGVNSSATATGKINGNTISNLGDGGVDNGIELQVQMNTALVCQIDNNTINGGSDDGIRVRIFDTATGDITISNNAVGLTTGHFADGIEVQTRSGTPTLCLDIFNNNCAVGDAYVMNHDAGTFDLLDIVGVVGGTTPWTPGEVDTYLGSSGVNKNNIGTKSTAAGTYTNCASITTP